jgi:hypothetical protein
MVLEDDLLSRSSSSSSSSSSSMLESNPEQLETPFIKLDRLLAGSLLIDIDVEKEPLKSDKLLRAAVILEEES